MKVNRVLFIRMLRFFYQLLQSFANLQHITIIYNHIHMSILAHITPPTRPNMMPHHIIHHALICTDILYPIRWFIGHPITLIASKVPSPAMTIRFGRRMIGWRGWRTEFFLQVSAKNWTTASVPRSCVMKIWSLSSLSLLTWCRKVNLCKIKISIQWFSSCLHRLSQYQLSNSIYVSNW